jgi:hypothetical protein
MKTLDLIVIWSFKTHHFVVAFKVRIKKSSEDIGIPVAPLNGVMLAIWNESWIPNFSIAVSNVMFIFTGYVYKVILSNFTLKKLILND